MHWWTLECKWPASFFLLHLQSNSLTLKPSSPDHILSPLNTTGASPIVPYPLTSQVLSSSPLNPLSRSHPKLTLKNATYFVVVVNDDDFSTENFKSGSHLLRKMFSAGQQPIEPSVICQLVPAWCHLLLFQLMFLQPQGPCNFSRTAGMHLPVGHRFLTVSLNPSSTRLFFTHSSRYSTFHLCHSPSLILRRVDGYLCPWHPSSFLTIFCGIVALFPWIFYQFFLFLFSSLIQ